MTGLRRAAVMIGALLVVYVVAIVVTRPGVTNTHGAVSLVGSSMANGCLDALFAVGIVVIYRASRVINFAHGGVFVVSYALYSLVRRGPSHVISARWAWLAGPGRG